MDNRLIKEYLLFNKRLITCSKEELVDFYSNRDNAISFGIVSVMDHNHEGLLIATDDILDKTSAIYLNIMEKFSDDEEVMINMKVFENFYNSLQNNVSLDSSRGWFLSNQADSRMLTSFSYGRVEQFLLMAEKDYDNVVTLLNNEDYNKSDSSFISTLAYLVNYGDKEILSPELITKVTNKLEEIGNDLSLSRKENKKAKKLYKQVVNQRNNYGKNE